MDAGLKIMAVSFTNVSNPSNGLPLIINATVPSADHSGKCFKACIAEGSCNPWTFNPNFVSTEEYPSPSGNVDAVFTFPNLPTDGSIDPSNAYRIFIKGNANNSACGGAGYGSGWGMGNKYLYQITPNYNPFILTNPPIQNIIADAWITALPLVLIGTIGVGLGLWGMVLKKL